MSLLNDFLSALYSFLKAHDASGLQSYLRVEPPLPEHFKLAAELKASYTDRAKLEALIAKRLPGNDNDPEAGSGWAKFRIMMKHYLEFWRDVDFDDLLKTHAQLMEVLKWSTKAFDHPSGSILLPTMIQMCSALAKLALTLDQSPELTRRLRKAVDTGGEGEPAKSLAEQSAEMIQGSLIVCLAERGVGTDGIEDGRPAGKKVAVYTFANMVLKLFFQCHKTRPASQLFTNIITRSPPLELYPASQRVAYLYYLGRYYFLNGHFYRAQLCLQSSYEQCHRDAFKQRRAILVHLISSNLILGRFPSRALLCRPEARGLLERFAPISKAIKTGNLAAFKQSLGPESGNERWFFARGLLLPLLYRCEVLVWRSLARRVLLLTGETWDPDTRKAATVSFTDIVTAARLCQNILSMGGTKELGTNQGVIFGNKMPEVFEIEDVVANLVSQGLLRGFVSHAQGKFAVLGAKQHGGPLNAGFPVVWNVLSERAASEGRAVDVPGWIVGEKKTRGGNVVNLTGIARPVGGG